MINADLVGVEAQRTSPSITNPVTFVNDTTYAWSTPKWIVTREMMGITTIDQAKPAGVNSGGFIDKAGNLRILYTTMGNILGKASLQNMRFNSACQHGDSERDKHRPDQLDGRCGLPPRTRSN
ncbi:MAG: hypothetical protein EB132_04200 [Actinobacteria bacterium]|nr:hypothetical protein [Actinomycetota bacterium]